MENIKKIIKISKEFKINPKEEAIKQIQEEYKKIQIDIQKMEKINTENVKPMTRINNYPINFLREDIEEFDKEFPKFVLKNANKVEDNFILINKKRRDFEK